MASFGQHFMSTSTPKEATKTKKISTADKRQAAHKSAAEPAPLKVYPVLQLLYAFYKIAGTPGFIKKNHWLGYDLLLCLQIDSQNILIRKTNFVGFESGMRIIIKCWS